MLVEIHFLTQYGHMSKNVVYAGAAPGMHIEYLSRLFRDHTFYLYDPHEIKVQKSDRINVIQSYFTEKEAMMYKNLFKVLTN